MAGFDNGQTATGILFILLLLLIVGWGAKRGKFFRLPPPSPYVPITFLKALGSFLVYLIFAFVILPLLVVAFSSLLPKDITLNSMPSSWMGWLQLGALLLIFLLLIGYLFCLKRENRRYIFWQDKPKSPNRFLKGLGMGIVSLIVSYPFVLAIGALSKMISIWIWGDAAVDQVAVKQLKMTIGHPALFAFMIFAIVILVPFTEELLFRGFLQNFLKRYLPRGWAIIIAAIIFACAHFALSQGIGNFRLILTLAVLSFFLGFIYEREKTLWAPIAMHSAFNAASIAMIISGAE